MSHSVQITVSEECHFERLDIYVARVLEIVPSRSFAQRLILNKKVTVDEKLQKSSYRLQFGQCVTIETDFLNQSLENPGAENIPLQILFEDDHIIVINKAAGMVVHPGAGVASGTLVNALLGYCRVTLPSLGSRARAGIVHRLDRDTSGVMVVAKSQQALTSLSQQFANHQQLRIYRALVYGVPAPKEAQIETWHGRDPKNRLKFSVQPEGVGKKATLFYSTLDTFSQNFISFLSCKLFTGRTHQIRVQLSARGHGILGDALYTQVPSKMQGQKEVVSWISRYVTRQMLHALLLGFQHPTHGHYMEFEAPYPEDFQTVLKFLQSQ